MWSEGTDEPRAEPGLNFMTAQNYLRMGRNGVIRTAQKMNKSVQYLTLVPRRKEIVASSGNLRNEEFHNLYSYSNSRKYQVNEDAIAMAKDFGLESRRKNTAGKA
jgi:hypothetical protein